MAKATTGKTYAQVLNGKCHWIFTKIDLPEWNEDQILVVDVNGNVPTVGDDWNGTTFTAAPLQPISIPQSVTRFQARGALLQSGFLEEVEAVMSHADTDAMAKLAWTDAQEFKRYSPTILGIAPLLGLTDEDLDNLFIFAATIDA